MKCLILCNGDSPPAEKNAFDDIEYVIAVDGGANLARALEITPNIIIGDMDSITIENKTFFSANKKIQWKSFPAEKDFTDTELAIEHAREKGYSELIFTGILGNRTDHLMANMFLFQKLVRDGITLEIIEHIQDMYFVTTSLQLNGNKNDLLSLVPFGMDCQGITTKGLLYPLKSETLLSGSTRGISNVFIENSVSITLQSGILLAVHTAHRNK